MLKAFASSALLLLALVICIPTSHAQMLSVPAPGGTLTVTAFGSADATPEWVDVNLTLQSHGVTAAAALMMDRTTRDRAITQLVNKGIKREDITEAPMRLSTGGFAQMVAQPGKDDTKFFATSALTVRLPKYDPNTAYDDICAVIDAAGVGGAAMQGGMGMAEMMAAQELFTFGVKDTKPLRDRAIADAIANARTLAEATALNSGKKLGDIAGLQAMGPAGEGLISTFTRMFAGAPKPGRATYSVNITATFKLE